MWSPKAAVIFIGYLFFQGTNLCLFVRVGLEEKSISCAPFFFLFAF